METRGQFTFYRSYYEALKGLGKRDRLAVLEAVMAYGLDGVEPEGLSALQQAMFSLIQPTLDTGRKKASNGKIGGLRHPVTQKQTASKPQANGKQTASEKEKEKEKEIEKEIETETEGSGGVDFARFWDSYPVKIGQREAEDAWRRVKPEPEAVMAGLARWKNSQRWQREQGRYIPRPAKFLEEGYYASPPGDSPGPRQLDEDERAAIRRMMEEQG